MRGPTSSLDSLVGLLKALPETDDTQLSTEPPSLRSYSMPVDMGKANLPRARIWGEKPPINRAHSGFQFNAPSLKAAQVSMLVPGLGCSSSISRVPKPPVLVKVGEKMATAAQESFRAALTSKWVDEDGPDGEDTDGPDDGLTIRKDQGPRRMSHLGEHPLGHPAPSRPQRSWSACLCDTWP